MMSVNVWFQNTTKRKLQNDLTGLLYKGRFLGGLTCQVWEDLMFSFRSLSLFKQTQIYPDP